MRNLLCAALVLTACGRDESARTTTGDTLIADSTAMRADTAPAMSAVPDRLLGTWTARGYDAGTTQPQEFTITWSRAPDGGLTGTIAFRPGETYDVKLVSTGDATLVYESEPHRSPTLKAQVVTRTHARFVGDSLVGTYTARATEGQKVLQGRFSATRRTAIPSGNGER
jgi:hypothetical protein